MARVGSLAVEVVYWPKQTRVYLYGADGRAQSARGVQGQLAMKVYGNDRVFRYPLSYVAPSSDHSAQDYLSAAVDVRRIPDGQMSVAVELAGLPDPAQQQARVVQTFALSSLPVVVAALDESDRPRIAQQKVCPVTGGALGSMGAPVKALVAGEPIYLCCRGCLGKLQENPQAYLQKLSSAQGSTAPAASAAVTVTTATTADQAAIARQAVCVVSGGRLGAMGTPIKITVGGKSLFVCCRGCVSKVKADPAGYLAKAARLTADR